MTIPRMMRPDDALAVARLFAARFREQRAVDLDLIGRRLVRSYFEHPWPDSQIRPWVQEGETGEVIGFLGLTPRPLRWGSKTLLAALIGNLMVDARYAEAGASAQLIGAFLQGPQDLAISDAARDITRKICTRFGGETIRLLSQSWHLDLRPATRALTRLRDPSAYRISRTLMPVVDALDQMGRRMDRGPWKLPANAYQTRPLTPERLADLIAEHGAETLHPIYDAEALRWLLQTPPSRQSNLRAREVIDDRGNTLGWFVYFVERDAELIHIGAELGAGQRVFDCLVRDAATTGAQALTGRIVPSLMMAMSDRGATFATRDWTILYTHDPEIVAAFHAGDVFVQPMDCERWLMRFVDVP